MEGLVRSLTVGSRCSAQRFRSSRRSRWDTGVPPTLPNGHSTTTPWPKTRVELTRQLGLDGSFVVGYSDGGITGLDIALHHPERVIKLAITGTNARTDGYTSDNLDWIRTFYPSGMDAPDTYRRLSPDGPEHWPPFLERMRPMWATEPSFTNEQLGRIAAPTLIIIGDADIVTPECAVEMFRAISNSQLNIIPNAGHGTMPHDTVLTFLTA